MSVSYKEIIFEKLISFPLNDLIEGVEITFNAYVDDNGRRTLVIPKDSLVNKSLKEVIKKKYGEKLYCSSKEKDAFESYFKKNNNILRKEKRFDFEKYNSYLQIKENFFEIDKRLLIFFNNIPFNLYTPNDFTFECVFNSQEDKPNKNPDNILKEKLPIFIKISDIALYKDYLNDVISRADNKKIKTFVLKENSKIILKELLNDPRSKKAVVHVKELAQKIVSSIVEDKDTVFYLLSLRDYDYYTYTHSVNVSVISIGLGRIIGLTQNELEKLGIGLLMHDIGKSLIPIEILNKPGRLTDDEFEIMKGHVLKGSEILKEHEDISEESFLPLLQHHEKLSGKGYPFGLTKNQISLYGKISSIVDCYDALTTKRVYKPALTPFEALSIIKKEVTLGNFDEDIYKLLVKMFGKE